MKANVYCNHLVHNKKVFNFQKSVLIVQSSKRLLNLDLIEGQSKIKQQRESSSSCRLNTLLEKKKLETTLDHHQDKLAIV